MNKENDKPTPEETMEEARLDKIYPSSVIREVPMPSTVCYVDESSYIEYFEDCKECREPLSLDGKCLFCNGELKHVGRISKHYPIPKELV